MALRSPRLPFYAGSVTSTAVVQRATTSSHINIKYNIKSLLFQDTIKMNMFKMNFVKL